MLSCIISECSKRRFVETIRTTTLDVTSLFIDINRFFEIGSILLKNIKVNKYKTKIVSS